MRHDLGLAASPQVRYRLKMVGSVYSPPFMIVRCGRTTCHAKQRGRVPHTPMQFQGTKPVRNRVSPAARITAIRTAAGVRIGGLWNVAFDGCNSVKIPDTDRIQRWTGKIRYRMSLAGPVR
jgi:hypothetical protein